MIRIPEILRAAYCVQPCCQAARAPALPERGAPRVPDHPFDPQFFGSDLLLPTGVEKR